MNIHSLVTPPPRPSASTRPPQDKREAILDAALALFVERGFHGTAVPLVAERAGVGAGTIYRYFESKEALVNALYQQWKGALATEVLDGFPTGAPPREQFAAFWRGLAAFVAEHPRAYAFLELHHHGSYLDERSRAIEDQLIDFATAFIRSAQEQRVLRAAEPVLLMSIVYGAFVGLVRASWEGKLVLDQAQLEAAETCCWEAIRA
jgi:TetR/AcrR family transcriptional regulator, repressor of fatR-cypB operon